MARRCSLCGSWNDAEAQTCEECGELLSRPRWGWPLVLRVASAVLGVILIGSNGLTAIRPLLDARAAPDGGAIVLFLIGVVALAYGLRKR